MQATIQNGNREVTVKITGQNEWTGGENKRVYFDLDQNNKRQIFRGLYEVIKGSTRDLTIESNGRTFAVEFGIDVNSNSKHKAAIEGAKELISQITAQ